MENEPHIPAEGSTVTPPAPGETLCASAGWSADETILASLDESALRLTRADGSSLSLSIDDGALDGEIHHHSLRHRGALVAATASRVDIGGGTVTATSAIVVAHSDGSTLWRRVLDGVVAKVFALAQDGRALVHLYDYGQELWPIGYALLGAEGEPHYLTDFQPRGEPDEHGYIPGWLLEEGDKRVGWWDSENGQLIEAQWAGEAPWFVVQGGQLLSIPTGGVAPWLMVESPGDAEPVVLWDLPHDGQLPELLAHHPDGWLVLRDPGDDRWWRIETDDGAAAMVEPAWPDGGELFRGGCDDGQPIADARGRVLVPWRDASAARLQLIDPAAGSSADLGTPMTQIMAVDVRAAGGTFIATATDPNNSFCPAPEWSSPAPAGALDGPSIQLLRPDDGVHQVLPPSSYPPQPSADGLCVLYADDGELVLLDVLRDEHHKLGHGLATAWLR